MRDTAVDRSEGEQGYVGDLIRLAVFMALTALLQFYLPYPVDDDTAYHFSVARLIAEHGPLQSFPWTRFSWQFDHYGDKEFLFHLLFVPFLGLGFNNASRIVGIICGTLVLAALYWVLRRERVRYASVWTLIPLGVSLFVYRFAQVRPQLFSIALAILLVRALCRRNLKLLGAVSFLYPLSYVAFWQIPLLLLMAVEAARLLSGERLTWKPAATIAAGTALGLALHPNSWHLVQMNWIHMADVLLRNAWGAKVEFNMGEEFDPLSVTEWAQFLLAPLVMAIAALFAAWGNRRNESAPLGIALATLLFGLLTARSNRFLEYFVPFATIALAVASHRWGNRYLAPALLGGALLLTLAVGTLPYRNLGAREARNWEMQPEIARLFAERVPVGARVFTTGWEYTGSLLLNLPGREFMVALDPTLMYKRDPKLYDDWYRLLLHPPVDAAAIVRKRFDSRYVIAQNYEPLWPFFTAIERSPGVTTLYADDRWVLFDLGMPLSGAR